MEEAECLICGSKKANEIFHEDGIAILRCRDCGHVFSSFPGAEAYDGYFSAEIALDDHFWWREAHEKMYQCFRRRYLAGRSGRLLDFGCGLGYFLDGIQKDPATKDWRVSGAETSRSAAAFATTNLGLPDIFHGPAIAAGYPEKNFDFITLWDVLEHLPAPRPILADLRRWLKDDGTLFIATPNINIQLPKARLKRLLGAGLSGHYLEARDHLHDYSPRSLRRLLEESGFRRIEFIFLPPIASVSGSRNIFLRFLKEAWYQSSRLIFRFSAGRINLNNLNVLAYK